MLFYDYMLSVCTMFSYFLFVILSIELFGQLEGTYVRVLR